MAIVDRLAAALAALALCGAPARLAAQQPGALPSDSALGAMLRDRVEATKTGGIVLGVIDPDGRRRVVAYGASGTARPLDHRSVFEIGSVTKTFTGALLAEMVRRGEVALDAPVATLLPSSVTVPARGRPITLLDLATQSSGLPRMPANFAPKDMTNPYADYSVAQMYAFVSSYTPTRDAGAAYEYSNLGFGLLGHALALRAGTDWETALERRVTGPLGLRETRIALTPSMRERLALGHDEHGAVVANWDLPTFAGAGALRSTMDDMLAYAAANLAADLDSTRGALAPALHAAHVPRRTGLGPMRIGLAWNTATPPGAAPVVWHNGATGGYHSFVAWDAARHVAVVVLANSTSNIDDIGLHLLIPAVGLQVPTPPPAPTTR